jgi:hypothetical protein
MPFALDVRGAMVIDERTERVSPPTSPCTAVNGWFLVQLKRNGTRVQYTRNLYETFSHKIKK